MLYLKAFSPWDFGALRPETVNRVYENHFYMRDIVTGGLSEKMERTENWHQCLYYILENTESGCGL